MEASQDCSAVVVTIVPVAMAITISNLFHVSIGELNNMFHQCGIYQFLKLCLRQLYVIFQNNAIPQHTIIEFSLHATLYLLFFSNNQISLTIHFDHDVIYCVYLIVIVLYISYLSIETNYLLNL